MNSTILPGATLGVLGSGQLGRMFAIAARRLGYRVHVLSPDDDTPTGQVADQEFRASYDDLPAVSAFARGVSVVTFEFENVPAHTTTACEQFAPVRPGGHVLHISQNRLREKTFLQHAGIPVTPFLAVHSQADLLAGLEKFGCPAVLKTADWGYDGKGQAKINSSADVDSLWPKFAGHEAILEAYINFQCEVSVIGVRGLDGDFTSYGPIQNAHANHILDVSFAPAAIPPRIAREAVEIASEIFRRLDVVGVLCVEFFLGQDDRLMVNELAPRPHNSGHYTIDACATCQFEQQVRAVCGLPLGAPYQHQPAAMANLLGDIWQGGVPNWRSMLEADDVKLHLYGKAEARPGRKMGHLTAQADTAEQAVEKVLAARQTLFAR